MIWGEFGKAGRVTGDGPNRRRIQPVDATHWSVEDAAEKFMAAGPTANRRAMSEQEYSGRELD